MKPCVQCKTQLPDDAAFCYQCGAQQIQTEAGPALPSAALCPHCQMPTQPGQQYCQACGYPLSGGASDMPTVGIAPVQVERQAPQPDLRQVQAKPEKKSAQPASKPAKKAKLGKGSLRKIAFGVIGFLVLAVLLVVGWNLLKDRPAGPSQGAQVEACSPAEIPEDYEAANQADLEGDLRRDSYFRAGEEYTIAPNAAFRIPDGRTLIIEPGARVRFGEGAKLVVEGTLSACANRRQILFTADTETGRPGFWQGIEFRSADEGTMLGHVAIEFAGSDKHAAVWVENSRVHLEDITFDSNLWYSVSLDPDTEPLVRLPLAVENGPLGWEIRGGELTTSRIWASEQTTVVNGIIDITESASLDIPAGSLVKFLPGSALQIHGDLTVSGTNDRKVILTSVNDGAEEGAPKPVSGDWIGLVWSGRKGASTLQHMEIRYAGGQAPSGRITGCLWMEDAAPILENVSVSSCAAYALSTDLLSEPELSDFSLDVADPLKRWELRGSKIETVTTRMLASFETLDGAALDPVITGWLGIEEKATLAIGAGTKLLFYGGQNAGLWANGILKINGTQKEPVVMTSWNDASSGNGKPAAGDWGGLHINRGKPDQTVINWLEIRYAGAVENTCLRLLEESPRLDNIMISHCAGYPLSSNASAEPQITGLRLADNAARNLWQIRGSELSELRTWTWAPVVLESGEQLLRQVTGRVTVEQQAALKLAAGLELLFTSDGYLLVRGGIQAQGSEKEPILLTSWRDGELDVKESGAQPGDWAGLILDGAQAGQQLNHVEIRYAGVERQGIGCLTLNKASPKIDGLTIRHCSYYPVNSDIASDPEVSNLFLEDNYPTNAWAVRESRLERGSSRSWQVLTQAAVVDPLPRIVTGWITIDPGAQLEMQPRVVVRFRQNTGIQIEGSFSTLGEQNNPVVLTSWRDPEFSSEGGVQAGDWIGLLIDNPQGDVRMEVTEIRYAGGNRNPAGSLILTNAAPQFDSLLIRDSANYPINQDVQSTPRFSSLTLTNNNPGDVIVVRGSALDRPGETVWSAVTSSTGQQIIRLVTGKLDIHADSTLRLDPDLIVKFDNNGGIDVRGSLLADQAVLTSLHDDEYGGNTDSAAAGDPTWQGIRLFTRKPVRLVDSIVRYAQTGFWLENASISLTGTRIERCWQTAMSADMVSTVQVDNLTLAGNAINGLVLRGSELPEGEVRWALLGSPAQQLVRVLTESLEVTPRTQLYLEQGAVVKFAPQAGLIVEGQLYGEGTEEAPAVFTSLSDDDYAGDTDNSQVPASRGAWLGIIVNPNRTGSYLALRGAAIRYAVIGLTLTELTEWTYEQLTIADSLQYGISCDALTELSLDTGQIILLNNGDETAGCPTPDRE